MKQLNVSRTELLELRNQGYTNHEIAQQLGISPASVYRYISGNTQKKKPDVERYTIQPNVKILSTTAEIEGYTFVITDHVSCTCVDKNISFSMPVDEIEPFILALRKARSYANKNS